MWSRIYPHAVLLIFANILLKVSCKGSGSLTFLIDDTGSMYDDIRQVRNSVNRISNIVFNEKSSLIGNMALVTFNDPDAKVQVVTENRETFKRMLDGVNVYGGGDCWEPSMKGLLLALETSNRDSYIYVFTDAPAKDYLDGHYVKEMCQKKQSQIVFVLTGRCGDYYGAAPFDVYFDIAHACSGQAFDVTKNDVEAVLRTIEETIKGNKTVITSTIVPAGVKTDIPFTIDDHTDYAIVSVSGKDVTLDIKGPSFHLEKIMWNNNGKVAKLSNTKPGTYVATVMGQTRTSVVIVGRTDFFFSHGFSELKPKSLDDTSLQPIAESNVHLSISVNDDHHSVQIVSAQFLDMNEKPINNPMPLTEISKDFYATNLFVAPSQRFKVAVNGIIKATGKSIRRIGKIPITPPEPPKKLPNKTRPTVEIAEGKAIEIEYNSAVKLTCKVVAFPEPKIVWANMKGGVMPSKMSLVEYPYKYISYMDISNVSKEDRYKCYAVNDIGRDETTISVSVKDPFSVKTTPPGITKLTYGTAGTITCDITSHFPMDIHWYYANEITGQTREIVTSDKYEVSASRAQLKIKQMDLDLVGRYTCKVSLKNKEDVQKSFQTRVKIDGLSAPRITTKSSTIEGIEGDLALRIPCEVVGVPKPVITWKLKDAKITPDAKYSIEDGALVIMKPTEKDTSAYTCEAKNVISSVNVTFQAKVDKYPKKSGTVHYVYLKEGETRKLKCEAYNSESQSVKWFKTQEAGNKENIQIVNASPSDNDGNYTCRVSDKHGNIQTHTYVVNVGNAPKFISEDNSLSNWKGDITDITEYCDVHDAKPTPVVHWTFNGKVLTDLSSAGVGHYTCNVSNVHGSVLKQFDVKSTACLITRNSINALNMPLVLNNEGSWHKLETTDYYTIVEQEEKITLSCPSQKETSNAFKNFPKKSSLQAICYKEDSFIVDDKTYKFSDLQCTNSVQPTVIKKKVKCSTESSELISVGYNVPGFLEAYEVCFDHKMNMPLYTRIIMTETNNGASTGYNWYTYPGIGNAKTERGFTCKDASSSCCYGKSQLVNATDFNDGPAKKSAFIDPLNVIPAWLPCDTSKPSWEAINDMVRTQLPLYTDLVVWSGTHTLQEKNGAAIPRYLWKVVRFDDDDVMAIVYVNHPKPTESDIKCKTPEFCDKYEDWFSSDSSTYCCSLPDFLKSFGFHDTDIGESMDAVLDKIK